MPYKNLEDAKAWRKAHPRRVKDIKWKYTRRNKEKINARRALSDKRKELKKRYRIKHRAELTKKELARYYRKKKEINEKRRIYHKTSEVYRAYYRTKDKQYTQKYRNAEIKKTLSLKDKLNRAAKKSGLY